MGLWSWLRRPVGSDPYYASYDKSMQRIKDEMEKTMVSCPMLVVLTEEAHSFSAAA